MTRLLVPIRKPEPTDDCVRPLLSSERTCRMSFLAEEYSCWAALEGGGSGALSAVAAAAGTAPAARGAAADGGGAANMTGGLTATGAASAPAQSEARVRILASRCSFMPSRGENYSSPSSAGGGVSGVIMSPSLAALVFR